MDRAYLLDEITKIRRIIIERDGRFTLRECEKIAAVLEVDNVSLVAMLEAIRKDLLPQKFVLNLKDAERFQLLRTALQKNAEHVLLKKIAPEWAVLAENFKKPQADGEACQMAINKLRNQIKPYTDKVPKLVKYLNEYADLCEANFLNVLKLKVLRINLRFLPLLKEANEWFAACDNTSDKDAYWKIAEQLYLNYPSLFKEEVYYFSVIRGILDAFYRKAGKEPVLLDIPVEISLLEEVEQNIPEIELIAAEPDLHDFEQEQPVPESIPVQEEAESQQDDSERLEENVGQAEQIVPEAEPAEPETELIVSDPEPIQSEVTSAEVEVDSSEVEVGSSGTEVEPDQPEVVGDDSEVKQSGPVAETVEPEVQPVEPEVKPVEPEIEQSEIGAEATESEMKEPEVEAKQLDSEVKQPDSETKQPEPETKQPEPEIKQPEPERKEDIPDVQKKSKKPLYIIGSCVLLVLVAVCVYFVTRTKSEQPPVTPVVVADTTAVAEDTVATAPVVAPETTPAPKAVEPKKEEPKAEQQPQSKPQPETKTPADKPEQQAEPAKVEKKVQANSLEAAREATQNGDYKKAFDIYHSLANAGNAEAQYCLGLMYETGKGVGIDIFEAVMWYRKSKAKGFALAERKLLELGYN
ncbi:MAG: hypothetical protein BHV75_07485 [Bacteroides oleiciplenus]|nr:MAG: hypothetical protein BHV75_07485 [Bacteroides oleiciplenus]